MDTLAEFVEICSRSGQNLDKMTQFADRFPKEGEDLFLTMARNNLRGTCSPDERCQLAASPWPRRGLPDNPGAYC